MPAKFHFAVRYDVTAVCETPLRTGSGEGGPEELLRHRDGQPFLQGSSLCGALRSWVEQEASAAMADALFGNQRCEGHLNVSEALFDWGGGTQLRPRLKLNGATASAENGKKFDVAHISVGTKLTFHLVWTGEETEWKSEQKTVEEMLSGLQNGEIRLGAQKSNGFGRIRLETVLRRTYDLRNGDDRQAWLEDRLDGQPIALPVRQMYKYTVFTVTAEADSILVKASAPEYLEATNNKGKPIKKTVTTNLEENGVAILPGSSIKGAVRARTEAIAALLGIDREITDHLFGRMSNGQDNGLPGLVRFEDVSLCPRDQDTVRPISRIHIDRFTGGVIRGGLFTEMPLSAPVTFTVTLSAEEEAGCALLTYALRDLGLGLYNLGSGGSVGRGYLRVRSIEVKTPDGASAALRFREGEASMDDPGGIFRRWTEGLEGMRHEA